MFNLSSAARSVAESFNLVNHRNVIALNNVYGPGSASTPSFGTAIATSTPRRIQLSLNYEF